MAKILVCQHVPHELLGTLNPLLKDVGLRIRYVNFGRHPHEEPDLAGYDGLIVLGGPMNVDEVERHPHLFTEIRLIEEALQRQIPVLGVCLGAQLIAKALGARVCRSRVREIGWYDIAVTADGHGDCLLKHCHKSEKIFQWHADTFDLPRGAVHLATSATCENQAFRFGDKVYGFQFHLEVDEPMIERWLKVPGNKRELEEMAGTTDAEKIRAETIHHIGRLKTLSHKIFGEFAGLFGFAKNVVRLSSR